MSPFPNSRDKRRLDGHGHVVHLLQLHKSVGNGRDRGGSRRCLQNESAKNERWTRGWEGGMTKFWGKKNLEGAKIVGGSQSCLQIERGRSAMDYQNRGKIGEF